RLQGQSQELEETQGQSGLAVGNCSAIACWLFTSQVQDRSSLRIVGTQTVGRSASIQSSQCLPGFPTISGWQGSQCPRFCVSRGGRVLVRVKEREKDQVLV